MKLPFRCPTVSRLFDSSEYSIADSRIIYDKAGKKVFQATITLQHPCPFCGQHHSYQAEDLLCPLSVAENAL